MSSIITTWVRKQPAGSRQIRSSFSVRLESQGLRKLRKHPCRF